MMVCLETLLLCDNTYDMGEFCSTAVCYGSIGSGRLGWGDNRETGRLSIKARGTDIANHMRRQYNSIAVQPYPAPVRNRGDTE